MNPIKKLIVYYDPKNFPEEKAQIYIDAFKHVDPELLERAVSKHIETSVYFPRVSELMALVRKADRDNETYKTDVLEKDYKWWKQQGGIGGKLQVYADQFWNPTTTLNQEPLRAYQWLPDGSLEEL